MRKLIFPAILIALLVLSSCSGGIDTRTVSVSGDGQVFAQPDTASLIVSIKEEGKTTKEAQNKTNAKIQEVLQALTAAGIPNNDLKTSSLKFNDMKSYNQDTRRYDVIGREVSQSITVTFSDLTENPDSIVTALDTLGEIDGISIGNLNFRIKDSKSLYIEARKLAFEKAKQKAEELALYSDLSLGKAISISEENYSYGPGPLEQVNYARMDMYAPSEAPQSEIPGGEIAINYLVHIVFELN